MAKVLEALSGQGSRPVFICDFSPPRGSDRSFLEDAGQLTSDFICVAYNPGRAVRLDSITAAYEINKATGHETVFNLAPRDMNRLALESRLLGADLLGLQNVVVIQGDAFTERDGTKAAGDYTATEMISAIARLNEGLDYRAGKLTAPCNFCIGASIDLGRGLRDQARLTKRKVEAGAQFFISQPVFDMGEIRRFAEAYLEDTGSMLETPVFWGLQILIANGVLFSTVPEDLRRDLEAGREGVDIALESYQRLSEEGVRGIYLVPPILRGGARDYASANRFLQEVSA